MWLRTLRWEYYLVLSRWHGVIMGVLMRGRQKGHSQKGDVRTKAEAKKEGERDRDRDLKVL